MYARCVDKWIGNWMDACVQFLVVGHGVWRACTVAFRPVGMKLECGEVGCSVDVVTVNCVLLDHVSTAVKN